MINRFDIAHFLRYGYIYDKTLGGQARTQLPKTGDMSKQIGEKPLYLADEIKQLLIQTVSSSLDNQHSPALFLSGGIDSPLIAAVAQSLSSKPLKAFTFSTQDEPTDEACQASRYADEIGLEHHIVTSDPNDLPEIILELMPHCDEPPGFYSIIPTYLVCKQAKNHADVILTGDGADELFWGYASRMSRVIRLAPLFRLPKWQRKIRWWLLRRPFEWNARYFDTVGEWYRSGHEHNYESWLKEIFPTIPSIVEELRHYEYAGTDQDETAYWTRWNEFYGHMQASLTKTRMASAGAGISVEAPFLDQRMIEFASGLDWHTCLDIESEIGKKPLRELLGKYVAIPSEGKLGFNVPMGSWLRGPLRGMFEETVLNRDALMGLEINRGMMRKHFDDHLSSRLDRSWGLWIFLSLAIWEDVHKGSLNET
jgi:asparagine synthase (glutamine-hydrolysing)